MKKCIAFFLVLTLCALCFACGRQESAPQNGSTTTPAATKDAGTSKETLPEGSKIAFLVGTAAQDTQFTPLVLQISREYDSSVMTVALPEDSVENTLNVSRTAVATAQDPQVRVMIFSGIYAGVRMALQQVREQREDITLIVCDPVEDIAELREYADLILCIDQDAFAAQTVSRAKEMGAEHFVFYTSSRELRFAGITALQQAMETACKKEKLTFKTYACPDMQENGRTLESGEKYMAEDATRRDVEYGSKTALFCISPTLQGAVARVAAKHGMVMPSVFRPSALTLAQGLDVSLDNHETDNAFALAQLREKAEELDIHDRVGCWSVSAPEILLRAAFAYAQRVTEGKAELSEDVIRGFIADDTVTVRADGIVYALDAPSIVF